MRQFRRPSAIACFFLLFCRSRSIWTSVCYILYQASTWKLEFCVIVFASLLIACVCVCESETVWICFKPECQFNHSLCHLLCVMCVCVCMLGGYIHYFWKFAFRCCLCSAGSCAWSTGFSITTTTLFLYTHYTLAVSVYLLLFYFLL